MKKEWKYIKLRDIPLSEMDNGFFGFNVVEQDDIELTFVEGDKGAGHGFHRHEDLTEILIFLEGKCFFTVGGTDLNIEGGSLLYIPPEIDHKVRYEEKSKILRIKISTAKTDRNPSSD
jgi:quercetin dioxygenase-like cupin family protein